MQFNATFENEIKKVEEDISLAKNKISELEKQIISLNEKKAIYEGYLKGLRFAYNSENSIPEHQFKLRDTGTALFGY